MVCDPFHGVYAGGMHITLLLIPPLQKWQLGFDLFCIFLSIIYPNCTGTQLFLVPHSFLYCVAGGDIRLSVGTAAKGPRPPAVSRLTSIKSVMPSSHLTLCCPLLLLPHTYLSNPISKLLLLYSLTLYTL